MRKPQRKGRTSGTAARAALLRRARKAAGYTQEQAARLVGVKEETWQCFERGNQEPTAHLSVLMADALGVKVEDIYS